MGIVFSPTLSRILKTQFGDEVTVHYSRWHNQVMVTPPRGTESAVRTFLNERGYLTDSTRVLYDERRSIPVTDKVPVPRTARPRNHGLREVRRLLDTQLPGLFEVEYRDAGTVTVAAAAQCSTDSVKMAKFLLEKHGHHVLGLPSKRVFTVRV